MEDFLAFKKLLTPTIITVLFFIALAFFFLISLMLLIRGEPLSALAVIIVGPLVTRIYCELILLFFRMNETLNEILGSVGGSGRAAIGSSDSYATWSAGNDARKAAWLARQGG